MKIETKFDVGDYCLALHESEVKKFRVSEIGFSNVKCGDVAPVIMYELVDESNETHKDDDCTKYEYQCYKDLNDLCESLKRIYKDLDE